MSYVFREFEKSRLRFEGYKIHCSQKNQSLSNLLYSKTKQNKANKRAEIPAKTSGHLYVKFNMNHLFQSLARPHLLAFLL